MSGGGEGEVHSPLLVSPPLFLSLIRPILCRPYLMFEGTGGKRRDKGGDCVTAKIGHRYKISCTLPNGKKAAHAQLYVYSYLYFCSGPPLE